MDVKEYRTVDKSEWARGPWDHEPDKLQWQHDATGLPCLIVRNHLGSLCGYVGVHDRHPLFGKNYDEPEVDVHGGLTFAGGCQSGAIESEAICHVPPLGEADHVWWFGFDCGHAFDRSPRLECYLSKSLPNALKRQTHVGEYRNFDYVKSEVSKLAHQLMKYVP